MKEEFELHTKSKVEQIKQRKSNYEAAQETEDLKELILALHKKVDELTSQIDKGAE